MVCSRFVTNRSLHLHPSSSSPWLHSAASWTRFLLNVHLCGQAGIHFPPCSHTQPLPPSFLSITPLSQRWERWIRSWQFTFTLFVITGSVTPNNLCRNPNFLLLVPLPFLPFPFFLRLTQSTWVPHICLLYTITISGGGSWSSLPNCTLVKTKLHQ